jgi:hypothetical protein
MIVLVLLNIHENCLKLKSGFRIIHRFPAADVLDAQLLDWRKMYPIHVGEGESQGSYAHSSLEASTLPSSNGKILKEIRSESQERGSA